MTSKQFIAALDRLKLTQTAAAEFLGLSARQVRRIVAGAYKPPLAAGKLLRLMIAKDLTVADVK